MRLSKTLNPCVFLIVSAAICLGGCEKKETGNENTISATDLPSIRIVSLAPALTQMIVDMGQGELLVGVTKDDLAGPKDLVVVGEYNEPSIESLLALKPTHLFAMTTKESGASGLEAVAKTNGFLFAGYPSPASIEEIAQIIFDEQELLPVGAEKEVKGKKTTLSLGSMLGVAFKAYRVRLNFLARLAMLVDETAKAERKRVLVVIGVNPLMASGPGTVHHQVLSYLNAANAAGDATVSAPTYDKEKLLAAKPDVVLILSPQGLPLKSIAEDHRLMIFDGLDIPAVKNNRIHLVDDPLGLLPSTSIVGVAAKMGKLIHPEIADKIDAVMKADVNAHLAEIAKPKKQTSKSVESPSTKPAEGAKAPGSQPADMAKPESSNAGR